MRNSVSALDASLDECITKFGLDVDYDASPGCFSLRGESTFDSSLLASIDSFFALYRSNPNDPRVVDLMTEINDVALDFIYDKIGVHPIYTLEPLPDKLAIVGQKPEISDWREAQGGDPVFQQLLRLDNQYNETSKYRWRLGVSPSIFYKPSSPNTLMYRTAIYLDLQCKCRDCFSFKPVNVGSYDKLKNYLDTMREGLRDRFKVLLKKRWSIELLQVDEINL